MSYDMFQASKLDAEMILSTAGEAVADVDVGQSDLIRAVYKLLYKSTIDSIINGPKVQVAAPQKFLKTLVKRKPCIHVEEALCKEWAMKTDKNGDVVGEVAKAKAWAKKVTEGIQASREGQGALLSWITFLSLNELRQVQGALSSPPPGGAKILLPDLVAGGVGGVAKQVLLNKLDKAMVPDTFNPLRLSAAYRLLPGREAKAPPAGSPAKKVAYDLPVKFAEGEEQVRGAADLANAAGLPYSRQLLDIGQRLAPDGSQFNVIRLHRVFNMQSSAADRAGHMTLEKMLDEFATLIVRSAFFEKLGGGEDGENEFILRGKAEVLKYLINDGFSQLKVGGFNGKQKNAGCGFVQPHIMLPDGQTRVVFGAGDRSTCGSSGDRMRMGEQIKWSPWGTVLGILRVEKPLETHFEWVSYFQEMNFAGVKKLLDKECVYYMIMHTISPESPASPRFNAVKFEGNEAIFARLDKEMDRQNKNIGVISPTLTGEKLKDLRLRRAQAAAAETPNGEIAFGEPNPDTPDISNKVAIAKEAYQQCLTYGGDGDGPKRSVLHFAGKWLPLGEGSQRKGQLVCTVRETIGWKYVGKPSPDGEDKPSAARKIGMLCREFYVAKKFHQPSPFAPGFAAQWFMHKKRMGWE